MIVLGADTHKRSHTIAAVAAATGELRGEQTVAVGRRGFAGLLRWPRGLEGERVWALEDCRRVSDRWSGFSSSAASAAWCESRRTDSQGPQERPPARQVDPIHALNVARAALQEGLESFPAAHLAGPELDLRLLVDHRERLVGHRVELNSTLLWHLQDLWA